jgi:threonine synthase
MGLPISRLIVATNENDILARAFNAGDYSRGKLVPTASPSMDIQISSNFERLLFDLLRRDAEATRQAMAGFEATGRLALDGETLAEGRALFRAHRIDHDRMAGAMRWALDASGQLIDPHTAIGLAAARQEEAALDTPIVTLATAHAAKFPQAVEAVTGVFPLLPARAGPLFDLPEKFVRLPADVGAIRDFAESLGA